LYKAHKTRLLRVDLGTQSPTDPFQRWFHKYLRTFRCWRLSRKARSNSEGIGSVAGRQQRWSYQNTILIAELIRRVTTAGLTAVFIIAPLAIMSHESSKNIQLIVVLVCIIILSFLVSLFLKVLSFEMMAVSAGYAAVLSVFISNVPASAER
jgi:ABC-type polysaccharide/polyol phosphate export permease